MSKLTAVAVFLVAAIVRLENVVMADDDKPPRFKITTKRNTDKVEIQVEKDKTVFSIRSPHGISQAVIARTEANWPKTMILRLHLRGLERFRASNGRVTLDAAVSIEQEQPRTRLWKDGQENAPLNSNSPFAMEIRMLHSNGKPTKVIPLRNGFFEMQLPPAFFEGNPQSITANWVDFYRN